MKLSVRILHTSTSKIFCRVYRTYKIIYEWKSEKENEKETFSISYLMEIVRFLLCLFNNLSCFLDNRFIQFIIFESAYLVRVYSWRTHQMGAIS